MAISGIYVVSGFAGLKGFAGSGHTLFGRAEWSEHLTAEGVGS